MNLGIVIAIVRTSCKVSWIDTIEEFNEYSSCNSPWNYWKHRISQRNRTQYRRSIRRFYLKLWLASCSFCWKDITSILQFTYTSSLTIRSKTYSRDKCRSSDFRYQAIQINITTSGYCSFESNSSMNMYGYLYQNSFDPANPFLNLLLKDDNACRNNQFSLTTYCQANSSYVLVVTTYNPNVTGIFSIILSGSKNATFGLIGKHISHIQNHLKHFLIDLVFRWTQIFLSMHEQIQLIYDE